MTNIEQTDRAIRGELREYIEENFLYMRPDLELRDSDRFLELGVMDSLGFVELVDHVEWRFDLHVRDIEISEENFGSIDSLVRYIVSKRAP